MRRVKTHPAGKGRVHRAYIGALLIFATLISGSCSLTDDRDICCEAAVLHFRYVRKDVDEYKNFIRTMRHFLFDAEGKFMREEPSNPQHPQRLRFTNLAPGQYTLVTIANSSAKTALSNLIPERTTMEEFKAEVAGGSARLHNSDDLFWSTRAFTIERNKERSYISDLSNIHCKLHLKIFWHNRPPHATGAYTMALDKVPARYLLQAAADNLTIVIRKDGTGNEPTAKRVVHTFPKMLPPLQSHEIEKELYGSVLYGEFCTLRYTDEQIPVFSLFYGDKLVGKSIDLKRAFIAWGWYPDKHAEQIYRIQMEIFEDKIEVSQWLQGSVKDWEDGGTITVK